MFTLWFRFPQGFDEATWRAALRSEIGSRASERNVELSWDGEQLTIDTMDFVALAYAGKVSALLGGVKAGPIGSPGEYVPAPWTATPWVRMSLWKRLRIWIGPTGVAG